MENIKNLRESHESHPGQLVLALSHAHIAEVLVAGLLKARRQVGGDEVGRHVIHSLVVGGGRLHVERLHRLLPQG